MGAERDRVAGFGRLDYGLRQAGEWYRWGPYVSERQWGTVREDYSADGDAWNYLSFDQARSRAFRWGEDGLAGFCDIHQRLCLGLALWNGSDPILKERIFGLPSSQDEATLHVLPTAWFRNTWSWGDDKAQPTLTARQGGQPGYAAVDLIHPLVGEMELLAAPGPDGTVPELLFCNNETNAKLVFHS